LEIEVGRFRSPGAGLIAVEPKGTNLATFDGDTVILALGDDVTQEEAADLARLLNRQVYKVCVRELGA
jgi:hypothetical protein